jgi:hypothetical protein
VIQLGELFRLLVDSSYCLLRRIGANRIIYAGSRDCPKCFICILVRLTNLRIINVEKYAILQGGSFLQALGVGVFL